LTSEAVVRRAVRFENPPRLPCVFPGIGQSDYFGVAHARRRPEDGFGGRRTLVDDWGCVWEQWDGASMGEPKGHPIESWDCLTDYAWPDLAAPERYLHLPDVVQGAEGRFVMASVDGIFRRARFLRGFVNLMQDFYLEPANVRRLLEAILEITLQIVDRYADVEGIHGISMPEDWGTQTQPFLRTPMFREFFAPIYTRLFDAVHERGLIMRMHSDGRITDYIESFIEFGLDVIQLEQPLALGIEEIGRRYRGRICFEASVDIQKTLPRMDLTAIRKEICELLAHWATPEGGFIAVCYHGPDIGVPDRVIRDTLRAFRDVSESLHIGTP